MTDYILLVICIFSILLSLAFFGGWKRTEVKNKYLTRQLEYYKANYNTCDYNFNICKRMIK